jgi:GxxExxY protein
MNRQDAKDAKQKDRREPSPEADELARTVIGAAIEVHRTLGPGFLESVYEEALAVQLSLDQIPYRRQVVVSVDYKGIAIGEQRVDLIVGEILLVELKTVEMLARVHTAQVISYLKATELELGLLINFNVPVLTEGLKRIVWSPPSAWRPWRLGG